MRKSTSEFIHFIAQPDIFGQNGSEKVSKMDPTLIKPMENHQTNLAGNIFLWMKYFPWISKKKCLTWAFWDPKTCPDAYVLKGFGAWGENVIFDCRGFFAISRFLAPKQFLRPRVEKSPKNGDFPLSRFFGENGTRNS